MKSMSFTVFSYNATVLFIQPNPTQPNPTQPMDGPNPCPSLVALMMYRCIQGGPKQLGHRLITIFLPNVNRFTIFSPEDSLEKFAVKWILNDPPHLAYVATRRCETLTSAKQAINDKLQGSVATY